MFSDMNSSDKFWLILWGMVLVTIIFLISSVAKYNINATESENELVGKGYTKVYQCVPSSQLPVWSKDGEVINIKDIK